MTCDRIRPLLSGYHDDALSLDERTQVRAHLAMCPACQAVLASYERLYAALHDLDTAAVPADLRHNVYARIAAMEARGRFGLPFGSALVGTLRTAGGTAGLLAILAALVLAITQINEAPAPHHGFSPLAARIKTAPAVLLRKEHAPANSSPLPCPRQTAVAHLADARVGASDVVLGAERMRQSGSELDLSSLDVRTTASGAPLAAQPVTVTVASQGHQCVTKSVTRGPARAIPTIPASDGLAYVHLLSDAPLRTGKQNNNSPATVEWHSFAPNTAPLTFSSLPSLPSWSNLVTGLTAANSATVSYAVFSQTSGGVFNLDMSSGQAMRVLRFNSPQPPGQGYTHRFVRQVYATHGNRLIFVIVETGPHAYRSTLAMTTTNGITTIMSIPDRWYDYVISPDRTRIAWVQHPAGDDGIGTLQVATLGTHPVTQTIGTGGHPVWSPDGTELLYKNARPEGLWVWSERDGRSRPVILPGTYGAGHISTFTWAPDNRFFAYVVNRLGPKGTSAVWLGDAQTPGYTWKAFERRWISTIAWTRGAMPASSAAAVPTPATASAASVQTPGPQTTPDAGTSTPLETLKSFYDAINRRQYNQAYRYVYFMPGDWQDRTAFAKGYKDTITDTLATGKPVWGSATNSHATVCIPFALTAYHANKRVTHYGGWYLLTALKGQNPHFTDWAISLSHSQSSLNGRATTPTQAQCSLSYTPKH